MHLVLYDVCQYLYNCLHKKHLTIYHHRDDQAFWPVYENTIPVTELLLLMIAHSFLKTMRLTDRLMSQRGIFSIHTFDLYPEKIHLWLNDRACKFFRLDFQRALFHIDHFLL